MRKGDSNGRGKKQRRRFCAVRCRHCQYGADRHASQQLLEGLVAAAVMLIIILLCIFGPILSGYEFEGQDIGEMNKRS